MGKVKFNGKKTVLGQGLLKATKSLLPKTKDINIVNNDLLKRIETLEAKQIELPEVQQPVIINQEPKILEQKIVERIETIKEVSVVTKDKRSRQLNKALSNRLKANQVHTKAIALAQENTAFELRNIQELTYSLVKKHEILDSLVKQAQNEILEEKQRVKIVNLTPLYVLSGLSIILGILSLIIK